MRDWLNNLLGFNREIQLLEQLLIDRNKTIQELNSEIVVLNDRITELFSLLINKTTSNVTNYESNETKKFNAG